MSSYKDPNLPAIFTVDQAELRQFDRDLITALNEWHLSLKGILDRGVSFDENVDAARVSVTSDPTPGTEFFVAHGLGKIPKGYHVVGQDKPGSLYDSATPNTKTTLYFKSNAANVAFRLLVS